MKIYISIPITGRDENAQREFANHVAAEIRNAGHTPVNPFDTPPPTRQMTDKEKWAYFMGRDIEKLLLCDAILLCPGWTDSKGCSLECGIAAELNLKTFTDTYSIINYQQ